MGAAGGPVEVESYVDDPPRRFRGEEDGVNLVRRAAARRPRRVASCRGRCGILQREWHPGAPSPPSLEIDAHPSSLNGAVGEAFAARRAGSSAAAIPVIVRSAVTPA